MLTFAAPFMLTALAAVAIPLWLHWVKRHHRQAVPFPSLYFLTAISHPVRQRRQLRRLWLLALRMLLIALLALAFAHPLFTNPSSAPAVTSLPRSSLILIDRSLSMGYGDQWSDALASARELIAQHDDGDRVAIAWFDRQVVRATDFLPPTASTLQTSLANAAPSAQATRYESALAAAAGWLSERPATTLRQIYLISDFLTPRAQVPAELGEIGIIPIAVTAPTPLANTAIVAAEVRTTPTGRQLEATLFYSRIGEAADPAERLSGELRVESSSGDSYREAIQLTPNEATAVTLPLPPRRDDQAEQFELALAVVALDDELPQDNRYFLAQPATPSLAVALVNAEADSRRGRYLRQALRVMREPLVNLIEATPESLGDRLLDSPVAVVIINDVVEGIDAAALSRFVTGGGGLLVVAADGIRGGWSGADLLPGQLQLMVNNPATGLMADHYWHPLFAPLAPLMAGLLEVNVERYRQLTNLSEEAVVLLRYDSGNVALAARPVGRGAIWLWSSDLDGRWNDLPLQPYFVPLLQRLVTSLGQYRQPLSQFTAGDLLSPNYLPGAALLEQPGQGPINLTTETTAVPLEEPGFYRLHQRRSGQPTTPLAVNVDPVEARFLQQDPTAFSVTAPLPTATALAAEPAAATAIQRLWWYLLALTFVLLIIELLWVNRLAQRATAAAAHREEAQPPHPPAAAASSGVQRPVTERQSTKRRTA